MSRRIARVKRRAEEWQSTLSETKNKKAKTFHKETKSFKPFCKFYLEGKCNKGRNCYYSHDVKVAKRKEICKFYLQGHCGRFCVDQQEKPSSYSNGSMSSRLAKLDTCMFMHSEFPCKFFHTNTECYAGPKCKFSHKPLTEETRELLRSYLDSGTLPDDHKHFQSYTPKNGPPKATTATDWVTVEMTGDSPVDAEHSDYSFNYETDRKYTH